MRRVALSHQRNNKILPLNSFQGIFESLLKLTLQKELRTTVDFLYRFYESINLLSCENRVYFINKIPF